MRQISARASLGKIKDTVAATQRIVRLRDMGLLLLSAWESGCRCLRVLTNGCIRLREEVNRSVAAPQWNQVFPGGGVAPASTLPPLLDP
jgi:hypothetical protein